MRAAAWWIAASLSLPAVAQTCVTDRPSNSTVFVVIDIAPSFHERSQVVINFTESGAAVCSSSGKTTWDAPAARRWRDEMWQALAQSPETVERQARMIQLDGTRYNIRIETNMAVISMSLLDDEAVSDRLNGETPIVRWANAVRLDVTK